MRQLRLDAAARGQLVLVFVDVIGPTVVKLPPQVSLVCTKAAPPVT
jgi:hypothetical protein